LKGEVGDTGPGIRIVGMESGRGSKVTPLKGMFDAAGVAAGDGRVSGTGPLLVGDWTSPLELSLPLHANAARARALISMVNARRAIISVSG
jgi:hypothetical protein